MYEHFEHNDCVCSGFSFNFFQGAKHTLKHLHEHVP